MGGRTALQLLITPLVILNVKVVPSSSRDRVAGRYGDGIKIQVSATAEKGRANAAVINVLADFFDVKPSTIQLVTGATNPRKQFRIEGLSAQNLAEKLAGFS